MLVPQGLLPTLVTRPTEITLRIMRSVLKSYEQRTRVTSSIFWDITPCSPLNVNRRFGGKSCLHLQDRRINRARNRHEAGSKFFLAYSSTFKMDAICSSETSVDFQRTTRRYIPEDGTLHNHRCENLKSYREFFCMEVALLNTGLYCRQI
jgi:hypothetical protein